MNNLGWLYQKGGGVTKDLTKAREWHQKGADAGSEEAGTNLIGLRIRGFFRFLERDAWE